MPSFPAGARLPSPSPIKPYSGGRLPAHAGDRLAKRLNEIDSLDGVTVASGLQGRGAVTVAGHPSGDKTDNLLVIIGRAHEYGLGVPMRPWLRTALARHGKVWVGGLKTALKQQAAGDIAAARQTLRQVGVVMVGDIQQTVEKGPWKELADATIAAKGSSRPLIDSGQMIQSVRSTVEGPGLAGELIG